MRSTSLSVSGKARVFHLPFAGEGGPTKTCRMRARGDSGGVSRFGEAPHPTPLRGATPDQARGRLFSRKREKKEP